MPQKVSPKCAQCEKVESPMWKSSDAGIICYDCFEQNINTEQIKSEVVEELEVQKEENENGEKISSKPRKSARMTRFKAKTAAATKVNNKGRGRRHIFKKRVFKSPMVPASTKTVESVFYKGSYMQVGDIVSVMDAKDNVYYAQIRGLLVDTYCEKAAFLTWLIPTQYSPSPNERFDPSTYLIGPEEDCPRKLSCLEFIMHAPSNYYHDRTTPFPPPDSMDFDSRPTGFIWTSLTEQAVKAK
ncbi:GATA zinc finger domain-containing protein 1 [Condylostylus longicornis]|uniref:GATA zinc finger domain-containing protein 1 n=1 Tax=Condylostylus longicornis TaxID=2530218 RepID=UPI00244E0510|nr:GATA zinc finger domain-containing protein 1 [Condylostylus longicornis]